MKKREIERRSQRRLWREYKKEKYIRRKLEQYSAIARKYIRESKNENS